MGGRITPTLLYATSKFHNDNPKTFKVFFDALQWIESHKAEAAETYFRVEQSKLDPAFVKSVIDNPDVSLTTTPKGAFKYAAFLAKIGAIKTKPASGKDYRFEERKVLSLLSSSRNQTIRRSCHEAIRRARCLAKRDCGLRSQRERSSDF